MARDDPAPARRASACLSPGAVSAQQGERVLGVVSDTHGLLRPELLAALAGVERIVHAGDIGAPEVLARLAALAPVVAVRGNNDTAPWARGLRERETLTVGGARILVLHDHKDLAAEELAALAPAVVISGHSHKPSLENLRLEISSPRPDITNLRSDISKARLDISKARLDISKPRPDISKARLDVSKPRLDISNLRSDISKARLDITKARPDISKPRSDITKSRFRDMKPRHYFSCVHP